MCVCVNLFVVNSNIQLALEFHHVFNLNLVELHECVCVYEIILYHIYIYSWLIYVRVARIDSSLQLLYYSFDFFVNCLFIS